MGWINRGPHSGGDVLMSRTEVCFVTVSIIGACPECRTPFRVDFTKNSIHGAFSPVNFACPCGAFTYDPEDDAYAERDTSMTVEELRRRYAENATLELR